MSSVGSCGRAVGGKSLLKQGGGEAAGHLKTARTTNNENSEGRSRNSVGTTGEARGQYLGSWQRVRKGEDGGD